MSTMSSASSTSTPRLLQIALVLGVSLVIVFLFRVLAQVLLVDITTLTFQFYARSPAELLVGIPPASLLMINMTPIIAGFFFAEVARAISSRVRANGSSRPRKIWRSVLLAFSIAGLQGYLFTRIYFVPDPFGPAIRYFWVGVLFYSSGTLITFLLAHSVTRFGFGNGFSLLTLWFGAELVIYSAAESSDRVIGIKLVAFLLSVMAASFLLHLRPTSICTQGSSSPIDFELPLAPQSIAVVGLSGHVMRMGMGLMGGGSVGEIPRWLESCLLFLVLYGLSAICCRWFANPRAIGVGTDQHVVLDRTRATDLDVAMHSSMRVMVLGGLVATSPRLGLEWSSGTTLLAFAIVAGAVLADYWHEFSFRLRFGNGQSIATVDNVHLAAYAKGLLSSQGIPCRISAYFHRRLLMVFGAYLRMRLYVPVSQSGAAKKALEGVI